MLMLAAAAAAAAPTDDQVAQNWPCFRGPAAGIVHGEIPSDFDGASGRNIRWKSPVPLPGNNSPIVWGDRIFLSGATRERQEVFCFDAETGALRWHKEVVFRPQKMPAADDEVPRGPKERGAPIPFGLVFRLQTVRHLPVVVPRQALVR